MTALLIIALVLAVWLAFPSPRAAGQRTRRALQVAGAGSSAADGRPRSRRRRAGGGRLRGGGSAGAGLVPMTVVVQQLAALLKGGRIPARLWDELWVLYGGDAARGWSAGHVAGAGGDQARAGSGAVLGPESLRILAAARAAALRGSSVAAAIRREVSGGSAGEGVVVVAAMEAVGVRAGGDVRVWGELAACFDTAEASGCPLADVLARFAAHLETEDDAEAARQTALAGPRATVRLLTWLPLSGLALGLLLGVDPVATLLGNPWGLAALAAGVALTAVGRLWSSRLVRAAAEARS